MKYALLTALLIAIALSNPAGVQAQEQDESIKALGEIRRGEFVTVEGRVTRMRDYDEFRIEDGTGRADIYVRGGMRRPAFGNGDTVIVRGWVDDDLIDIPREIYATQIELEDGTVIEVPSGDWD